MHLEQIVSESTKADILDKLEEVTNNLPTEYERTFSRIKQSPARAKLAFRIFQWLLAAQRPLTVDQLCEALAISMQDGTLRKARKPSKEIILDSCMGLVRVNKSSNTFEFFHFTIKGYILSHKEIQSRLTVDIPRACLTYLRYRDFLERCEDAGSIAERKNQYPFCRYIGEFWAEHVRGTPEDRMKDTLIEFLTSDNILSVAQLVPPQARNVRLVGREIDYAPRAPVIPPTKELAIYLCTYFRLKTALRTFLEEGVSPNICAPWGEQYTSLHIAVCYGDMDILQILINGGGNPNVGDRWGLTAVHLAARLQSSVERDLLKLLLTSNPYLEIMDQDGRTALHLAVRYALPESVKLLLSAGASTGCKDHQGKTPLHLAVERGHCEIVTTLLDNQADPTATNDHGCSVLALALYLQDAAIVETLLKSVDNDGARYQFNTIDKSASEGFLAKLADYLGIERRKKYELERKEAVAHHYRTRYCNATITEFAWAAEKGAYGRLRELIDGGAEINRQDPVTGKTALHLASENNRDTAVRYLIHVGADPDIKDACGRTAKDYGENGFSEVSCIEPKLFLCLNAREIVEVLLCEDDANGNKALKYCRTTR